MFSVVLGVILGVIWPGILRSRPLPEWWGLVLLAVITCVWLFFTVALTYGLVHSLLTRVTIDAGAGTTTVTYAGLIRRTVHELPARLVIGRRVDQVSVGLGFSSRWRGGLSILIVFGHTTDPRTERSALKAVEPLRTLLEDCGITLREISR